jgi:hypothetical protein
MGIVNVTQIAATNAVHRFGEGPTDSRQFVVEVDDPNTTTPDIAAAPGIGRLDTHPEYPYLRAFDVSVEQYNGSRWHYMVRWDYQVPKNQGVVENPLARPDIWRWSTGAISVPALYYYDDSDNLKSLVNTAGEPFEGITADLPTLTAHISGSRPSFDFGLATSVHGALNDSAYLGGAAYTWRVDGISGEPAVEIVGGQELRYFRVEVALTYRPDGWRLQIPNVGWNYVESSTKKRVYTTFVDDSGAPQRVPASNPQPLDTNGMIVTSSPGESNPPTLLTRRISRKVNFTSYFGVPT